MTWRAKNLTLTVLVVLVALTGCDAVLPFQATPGQPDARLDAPRPDAGRSDAKPRDAEADTASPAGDARGADTATPRDAATPDALAGDAARDQGTDTAPPVDAVGAETIVSGPCAPSAVEVPWKAKMLLCQVASGSATQCDAAQHCGAGWHLCTASEYLANGGKTEVPPGSPLSGYWLASCVRLGDVVSPPTDFACGGPCGASSAAPLVVSWSCSSAGTIAYGSSFVGVQSSSSCHRLGANDKVHQAYWSARSEASSTQGAVCCQ